MKGNKSAQALWKDYRFLTKEMKKFLTKQDMELFHNLMEQRERLQTIINEAEDDGFSVSPEGREMLIEIRKDNQDITNSVQFLLNRSKRQHQVSEAYNAASTTAVNQMSWKR